MIDEIALRKDMARAARAEALLADELLNESLTTLEADYTKALFLTHPSDSLGREKLYLAVNVVRKVKDHLAGVVSNGELAKHQLRDLAGEQPKQWSEVV